MLDNRRWTDEDELAETYTRRKGFAYGRSGKARQAALGPCSPASARLSEPRLGRARRHDVDTLLRHLAASAAVERAGRRSQRARRSTSATRPAATARCARSAEQVALETRRRGPRRSIPKWYEGMLAHGYEGVRQIEAHVTNTLGWSATTGQVAPGSTSARRPSCSTGDARTPREPEPPRLGRMANRLLEAHERHTGPRPTRRSTRCAAPARSWRGPPRGRHHRRGWPA